MSISISTSIPTSISKFTNKTRTLILALLGMTFVGLASNAIAGNHSHAQNPKVASSTKAQGNFSLKNAWLRQTLQANSNTAGYGILTSEKACEAVVLNSDIANSTEIHQMLMDGKTMKMQAITPFSIKAKQSIELSGELHMMLMGVKPILEPQQKVKITIACQKPVLPAQSFMVVVKSIQTNAKNSNHSENSNYANHQNHPNHPNHLSHEGH